MQLPPRHKDTKVHKAFIFIDLFLVRLSALVPWWQKNGLGGRRVQRRKGSKVQGYKGSKEQRDKGIKVQRFNGSRG